MTNVSLNMEQKRGIVAKSTKRRIHHLPCTSAAMDSWGMSKYCFKALPKRSKITSSHQSPPSARPCIGRNREAKFRERTKKHEQPEKALYLRVCDQFNGKVFINGEMIRRRAKRLLPIINSKLPEALQMNHNFRRVVGEL